MPIQTCVDCGNSPAADILPRISLSSERIQTLLSNNDGFADNEKRVLRDFVVDGELNLSVLDGRIALVESLLQDLKKAREELDIAVTERRKILHPVRSLPGDLLLEIFKHGSGIYDNPDDLFRSQWHSLDLSSAPWVYGHVSRRWRQTSINTPVLWTRFKITDWPMRSGHRSSQLQNLAFPALIAYLRRSNASPLVVYLDPTPSVMNVGNHQQLSQDNYSAISAILLPHSARWESLHLGPANCLDPRFLSGDTFPLLKSLTLKTRLSGFFIQSLIAPQLRSWRTTGNISVDTITTLSTIQSYSSSGARCSEILRTITLLPNLQRLSVCSIQDSHSTIMRGRSISLPIVRLDGLKELEIEPSANVEALSFFLDLISCRSLQSLSVQASGVSASTFRSFEERSNFRLKRWDFTSPAYSATSTIRHTESIETIVANVMSTEVPNPVISQLSVPNHSLNQVSNLYNSAIPCPRLRRLELHLKPAHDWVTLWNWDIVDQLYECIRSRIAAAASIGKANVTPLEIVIMAPDDLMEGLRRHRRLAELRLLGIRVETIGC
ncbi:hypothetical protein D9757_011811 [Collybiopsis confluens]|uniref:F-box domain-containing protein n=1 Tax=Collybiopsis confluens TaxID=2823264 RepID=A0A8H5GGU0_9AGAR|nr:hypothetical protein D9757_011811 [Collybiopsis confluens]